MYPQYTPYIKNNALLLSSTPAAGKKSEERRKTQSYYWNYNPVPRPRPPVLPARCFSILSRGEYIQFVAVVTTFSDFGADYMYFLTIF